MAYLLEGSLVFGVGIIAILTYRFFIIPMPPQAEEKTKRRILLLIWWILGRVTKLRMWLGKGHEMLLLQLEPPPRSHPGDTVITENTVLGGIPVRIFRPTKTNTSDEKLPGVIYFHGGGWCWEVWEGYDSVLRILVRLRKMVIVSVRYRLAPKNPFPAAPDDCFAVTRYVLENTETLGINQNYVTLMGDSAGGNLAMAMMIKLLSSSIERENLPKIRNLVLIYPALQAVNFRTPSFQKYRGSNVPTILSSELMMKFYVAYALGMEIVNVDELLENCHWTNEVKEKTIWVKIDTLPPQLREGVDNSSKPKLVNPTLAKKLNKYFLDPLFSPLLVDDNVLKRFPESYILSAEMDPLRDDSFFLVNRLHRLGINVRHRHWKGMDHGFVSLPDLFSSSQKALAEIVEYLKEH
ncbi:arylacetamide deacetylase-like [Saccostrea echinata]|uniref:arylacetamide deacetylase-like n=1 Tax=Saccostrea echinata TaxID=191078 RepID=UPI002A7FB943|nr:arylacetamide deacetylase-like [Saccostrea echinata]